MLLHHRSSQSRFLVSFGFNCVFEKEKILIEKKIMARQNECCRIDGNLLPLKAHYFLFNFATWVVYPFYPVFAKQLKISATATGVIFSVVQFLKIITNPAFGFLVDYFKKFRLIISLAMVCLATTHVIMLHTPPLRDETELIESNAQVCLSYCFLDTVSNASKVAFSKPYVEPSMHKNKLEVIYKAKCNAQSFDSISALLYNRTGKESQLQKTISCHLEETKYIDEYSKGTGKVLTKDNLNVVQIGITCSEKSDENIALSVYTSFKNMSANEEDAINSLLLSKLNLNNTVGSCSEARSLGSPIQSILLHSKYIDFDTSKDYRCICTQWLLCNVNTSANFSTVSTQDPNHIPDFYYRSFWFLLVLFAITSSCLAAVGFISDALSYELLENNEGEYGKQRLYGAIGSGLGGFFGGNLNQLFYAGDSITDYSLSFYVHFLLILVGLIPVYFIKVENVKYSANIWKDVRSVFLSNVDLLLNLVMFFIIGLVSSLLWNYHFWFMEEIGASQMLLGFSQIADFFLAEVPCFFISGWVIRKIGHVNCNSLALLCLGLQFLWFCYMQNPWTDLATAILSGPTYGIFFASMTMYGKAESLPGTETTVQSVLAVVYEGAGYATGSILGGLGFDALGSRRTFFYAGIGCFVTFFINVMLGFFVFKRKETSSIVVK